MNKNKRLFKEQFLNIFVLVVRFTLKIAVLADLASKCVKESVV